MFINRTLVLNCRPLQGVILGTSIPLQDLIEKANTIKIKLIPKFQDMVKHISIPKRVKDHIIQTLKERSPISSIPTPLPITSFSMEAHTRYSHLCTSMPIPFKSNTMLNTPTCIRSWKNYKNKQWM